MQKIKFGTDGWRAVIAEDFTFSNLEIVINAISAYLIKNGLSSKGIFIGYDNRFLSGEFANHCASVFSLNKIKTIISKTSVPTPLTAFMAVDLKLGGAIMITASHNPAKYSGIKFIPHYGGPAVDRITKEIENNIENIVSGKKDFILKTQSSQKNKQRDINNDNNMGAETAKEKGLGKPGNYTDIKIISDFSSYKKKLLGSVDTGLIKKYRPGIALDTMNGSGSIMLPEILIEYLGLKPRILNAFRDPLFGGKLPDPSEKNLEELKECVSNNKLDMGIALDGDADRFGAFDAKGIFISPNIALSLVLYYLIETGRFSTGDFAVRTVATTHLIDEICKDNDLGIIETPVGFKFIGEQMLNGNVLIGGEESGGLSIKGHIPEKDGLLASLILIEIQSYLKKLYKGMHISDYMEIIYGKYGHFYNARLDIEVPLDKKAEVLEYFINFKEKSVKNINVEKIINTDGAKIILKNKSWFLVRASGTEPLIRCYIESRDKNFFKVLKNYVNNKVANLMT